MSIIFTLPEDDLPPIAAKFQPGVLDVEAYSRDGALKLGVGKLTLIDNEINQTTATIRLRAVFDNPKSALWPNEFVKARLLLTTQKDAIVIPAAAIQRGPTGMFVYVVGGENTAATQPIELDSIQGDSAIISKGLSPGQQVVIDGQNQIRPGSKVSSRPSDKPSGSSAVSTFPPASASAAASGIAPPAGSASGGPRTPGASP